MKSFALPLLGVGLVVLGMLAVVAVADPPVIWIQPGDGKGLVRPYPGWPGGRVQVNSYVASDVWDDPNVNYWKLATGWDITNCRLRQSDVEDVWSLFDAYGWHTRPPYTSPVWWGWFPSGWETSKQGIIAKARFTVARCSADDLPMTMTVALSTERVWVGNRFYPGTAIWGAWHAPEPHVVDETPIVFTLVKAADITADGDVDFDDLLRLLPNYGRDDELEYADGDLDSDGDVDLGDLTAMIGHMLD